MVATLASRSWIAPPGAAQEPWRFAPALVSEDGPLPPWRLRVEPVHGEGSLIELSGQGLRVRIGRHLRPELRAPLAQESRRALRSAALRDPDLETK